ncbi:acyl-CoA synthetase [Nocardia xishanensis]
MLLTSLDPTHPSATDAAAAITVGPDSMSRAQVYQAAVTLASSLPNSGPAAVHATPTLETVIAVTACLLAGVTVVPVPPDSGSAELHHILTDAKVTFWAGLPHPSSDLPAIPVSRHSHGGTTTLSTPADDDLAMIMYTSGTTGAPKGVELSHRALAAGIDALADAWQWTADDTVVHGLPLFHLHGLVLGVLGSLRIGSRVVHTEKPRPERYAAAVGTMYFAVPTVWSRIAADESSARELRRARLLVSGSAPLPTPVFDRIAELCGSAPIERYGMSETMVTLSTRADGPRIPGSVGQPVRGVETRLVAEDGQLVPNDGESIGRLQVRGPMLFDGYLNRPEETAATWTEDGWFNTGDVATRDAVGFHRIVGRESVDLIKSGGYRIGAGEVETALLAHPSVQEVAVVGQADPDLGQRVVAYVVTERQNRSSLADALISFVTDTLSHHKRPREVVFVDELPRNALGKVQKKQLTQQSPTS